MENKKLTVENRVNRFMLIIISVIDAFLMFGYIPEFAKGLFAPAYIVVHETFLVVSLGLDYYCYKYKPKSFKYVSLYGYMVIYLVVLLGSHNDLVYAVAFPITMVYMLYYDAKLIKGICIYFSAANIIDAIYIVAIMKHAHSGRPVDQSSLILQVATMAVFQVTLMCETIISNSNNSEKISKITEMTNKVSNAIGDINGRLNTLRESSSQTKLSMKEINVGVSDTAGAVQNQLNQTEEIQVKLEDVQTESRLIGENVTKTIESVKDGNRSVSELVKNSETTVDISQDVANKLSTLQNNMDEMNSITKIIDTIAFQTNIMALNANVEAARAGEAGRGFAVVASEISRMADQTKEATTNITDLITNVSSALTGVVESVGQMEKAISNEKECTSTTEQVFNTIETNTVEVQCHIESLLANIENLTEANKAIVNLVQTISASSEQVSVLASSALESENKNAKAVAEVAEMVDELARM